MNVIGEVQGKIAVILDDMIDTAGTLTQAANALMDKGAVKVYAYATHAVLSGPAVERIMKSPIEEVVVTDTIPLRPEAEACRKINALSVAALLAEAVRTDPLGRLPLEFVCRNGGLRPRPSGGRWAPRR